MFTCKNLLFRYQTTRVFDGFRCPRYVHVLVFSCRGSDTPSRFLLTFCGHVFLCTESVSKMWSSFLVSHSLNPRHCLLQDNHIDIYKILQKWLWIIVFHHSISITPQRVILSPHPQKLLHIKTKKACSFGGSWRCSPFFSQKTCDCRRFCFELWTFVARIDCKWPWKLHGLFWRPGLGWWLVFWSQTLVVPSGDFWPCWGFLKGLGHLKPSKPQFLVPKNRFLEVKTFVFHGFGCPW